ncbi:MAG: ABC transporter ATP-binding protein [Proteobacteria bacterium]|nr:ABC transporter ATP-binding protein [Pseudomonadota bacterium]
MASLDLEELTKSFGDGFVALDSLSLSLASGEFLVLVGPSGCGKSTALRLIAGLETASSGEVKLAGRSMTGVAPRDRDMSMVFQNYALYPQMTVFENIEFPLRLRKMPKGKRASEVNRVAELLQLSSQLGKKPAQLSGGQRQRVAMGRALIRQPQLSLMDEPLSNLDAQLRVQMRGDIRSLQREFRTTTVYVTHDQTEAMTMGDRVAVLRDGRLQQLGSPDEVFGSPKNLFVARFIGSPSMNLVYGQIEQSGTGLTLRIGSQLIMLPTKDDQRSASLRAYIGRRVVVGIRPHSLKDPVVTPMRDAGLIRGVVRLRESLGTETVLHVAVDAERFGGKTSSESEEVTLASETRLVACVDPASRVKEGESVALAIEAHRLHIFDRETEESIL